MSDINGSGEPQGHGGPVNQGAPKRDYFTKRQTLLVGASTVVAAALGVGCVFAVQDAVGLLRGAVSAQQQYTGQPAVGRDGGQYGLGGGYGYGSGGGLGGGSTQGGQSGDGSPFGGSTSGGTSGGASGSTTAATAAESKGIVLIDTELGYQDAEAAGTGIVLTSNGEVLTNNHVIEGSTAIKVEVVSTGQSYTATVVGDDPTDDVAVLQLQGAKGLATAATDSSAKVSSGDAVTGVGNAEGGGSLVAAPGQVTGLDQSITTEADGSDSSESLHGLIETNAGIEPGDSGGPLYDSSDKIVGMDTAASTGGAPDGYAIPISTALDIAKTIESGKAGGNVQLGYPAFLGIELSASDAAGSGAAAGGSDGGFGGGGSGGSGFGFGGGFAGGDSGFGGSLGGTDGSGFGAGSGLGSDAGSGSVGSTVQGAEVAGVVSNGPAEEAGIAAGDVITAVDGTSVSSADALQTALAAHKPGDHVSITWTDPSGQSHTASVTLTQGPAA